MHINVKITGTKSGIVALKTQTIHHIFKQYIGMIHEYPHSSLGIGFRYTCICFLLVSTFTESTVKKQNNNNKKEK